MSVPQTEYYRTRAAVERELARTSPDQHIAAIHLDLAERYDALIAKGEPQPELRVASS